MNEDKLRALQLNSAIEMGQHKRIKAIKRAADMSGYTKETFIREMNGLYYHIEYRAKVAMQILEVGEEGMTGKMLSELFDYCNQKIKEYLAII